MTTEEPHDTRGALWLAMAACILVSMAAGMERSCESLEHMASNARHPLWVQIPVHALTPVIIIIAARKMKRMKPSKTTERMGSLLAWVFVIVNVFATTRLTEYWSSGHITVRVLSVIVHEEYIPDMHPDSACFRSYSRGFRSVHVNGHTISPPWLPLPVDWSPWDKWVGSRELCSQANPLELRLNPHLREGRDADSDIP